MRALFFKKKQEPERTDDARIKNLEKINRDYTTIGVYGEPLSPYEVKSAVRTAIKDMRELIDREGTCPHCGKSLKGEAE